MNLRECLYKNVYVIEKNGNKHKGYVGLYENEFESGYGEPSIGILPNKEAKGGIELALSEIKSIEIVD